tara:strand:- start:452 stop:1225 length:774 start_codon:yes stop_codon:yes gene_type:complete
MTKSNSKNRKRRSKSSGKRRRRRRTVKVHKKFNRRRSRKNRRQKGGENPFKRFGRAFGRFTSGKKKPVSPQMNPNQLEQPDMQQNPLGQANMQQKRDDIFKGPVKNFMGRINNTVEKAQSEVQGIRENVVKQTQKLGNLMGNNNIEKRDLKSTKEQLNGFATNLNKINTQLGKFVAWFNKAEENPSICPCCRRPFDDKGKGVDQKPPAQGPPPAPGAGPLPPAPGAGPLPQAPEAPPPQAPEAVPLTQVQGNGELSF